MYAKFFKRIIDFCLSLVGIIVLSPLLVILMILGAVFMKGNPFFTQLRPGKDEKIFKLIKFRTMDNRKDADGNLLPDDVRLNKYGRFLRSTSLDELPELFNILKGDMAIVGPRPQLVRDMVFMTPEQRRRHTVRQGLTGWAQVNGRNGISWEDKFKYDLEYVDKISFLFDLKIIFMTVASVLKKDGITMEDMATAMDFGDYLVSRKKVAKEEYERKQEQAKRLMLDEVDLNLMDDEKIPFSVAMSVYKNDNPIYFDRALESITTLQSVLPDDIVIVVDGPVSQEIENVINKYQKMYSIFNVVKLQKNGGLGKALKIAVENAKYELIARMDSDDVAISTRFEQQLAYFVTHPEIDIVGGDITEFINAEENIVAKRVVPRQNIEIRKYMKRRCAMNHVTVMYKKTAIQTVGGYKDWFCNEDYYLWVRMWLNNSVFANTGTVLVNVRVGEQMYQRRGGKKYYNSEKELQYYMLKGKMISFPTYCMNVFERFIVQMAMPNCIRGWFFRRFARNRCGE